MTFKSDSVSGALKYVTGYTGFSSKIEEQSGHYLALHAEVPDVDDVTITVKINRVTTLDDDGIAVMRITDTTKNLIVTASKEGFEDVVQTFSLKDLALESE